MWPADRFESFYMQPERYIGHMTELKISQPIREQQPGQAQHTHKEKWRAWPAACWLAGLSQAGSCDLYTALGRYKSSHRAFWLLSDCISCDLSYCQSSLSMNMCLSFDYLILNLMPNTKSNWILKSTSPQTTITVCAMYSKLSLCVHIHICS